MHENELGQHALDHSLQAADDFSGYSKDHDVNRTLQSDWEKMADDFMKLLELADRNNMSLKASKKSLAPRNAFFLVTSWASMASVPQDTTYASLRRWWHLQTRVG